MISKNQANAIAAELLSARQRGRAARHGGFTSTYRLMITGFVLGGICNFWFDKTIFLGGLIGFVSAIVLRSGFDLILGLTAIAKENKKRSQRLPPL